MCERKEGLRGGWAVGLGVGVGVKRERERGTFGSERREEKHQGGYGWEMWGARRGQGDERNYVRCRVYLADKKEDDYKQLAFFFFFFLLKEIIKLI